VVAGEHARARLSEGHGGVVAALRLAEDEEERASQQDERQDVAQRCQQPQPTAGRPDDDLDFVVSELFLCHTQV